MTLTGPSVAMRLWEDEPRGETSEASRRDYEIVGYALGGRAELEIEGQRLILEKSDCWVVPKGRAPHVSVGSTARRGSVRP
jgi:quercetin dioxygenase-like cupin family protein